MGDGSLVPYAGKAFKRKLGAEISAYDALAEELGN